MFIIKKICQHTSIHDWAVTTSGFKKKQTSAILEFYFRFWFQLYHRNRSVIFYQAAEFHINRTIILRKYDVISIFKMAAAPAWYYFRFRICWCRCLQNVKICLLTKLRRHTSVHGGDRTTSGSVKQTSVILKFHFRFRSPPFRRKLLVIRRIQHNTQWIRFTILMLFLISTF